MRDFIEPTGDRGAATLDEQLHVPLSHLEGYGRESEPSLAQTALHVFRSEELFGPGLQQEWARIADSGDAQQAFLRSYEAYVSDPEILYRDAPDAYEFLRDYVFLGIEYREVVFAEQVSDALEALSTLEGLRPEVWERLSVDERLEVLQEMEVRLAERSGRRPAPVLAGTLPPNVFGEFSPNRYTIQINRELLADSRLLPHVVDTLAHEARHAYQAWAVAHPGFHPDAHQTYEWQLNFIQYFDATTWGPELYEQQPVERDAFAFGNAIRDGLYGGAHA